MKFIENSAWQYLSVKLPTIGAFIMLILLPALQWGVDFEVIPKEYHAFVTGTLMLGLSWIGKKISQPRLNGPQLTGQLVGINSLLNIPSPTKLDELAWIAEAKKHLGLQEIPGKQHNPTILKWLKELKAWWADDETAWCGTFVAHCLKVAGIAYPTHWYRALDYVNYGTKLAKPAYGCVAIKTRKGGGHVCFVVGRDMSSGKLVCLGGNQSNKVCYALYSESEFQEFRWYGLTPQPASKRYSLPQLKGVTATRVSEA